jgi:hypothetical protein
VRFSTSRTEDDPMARNFLYVSLGILALTLSYQIGAEQASADWNASALGQIVGLSAGNGSQPRIFLRNGESRYVNPPFGLVRDVEWADLPVPSEEIKIFGEGLLVTHDDSVWMFGLPPDGGWAFVGQIEGPISSTSNSWGKI